MRPRYFTLEEANVLLPQIEPLMAELLERRASVVHLRSEIEDILEDAHSDIGGPVASALVREFAAIEKLVEQIQSYGCILKDMNSGLLDFLTKRDGREVYLCWRYGEPNIAYYHELHTGYNGRKPV